MLRLQKRPFEQISDNLALIDSLAADYIGISELSGENPNPVFAKSMNLFALLDDANVLPTLDAVNKEVAINLMIDTLADKVDEQTLAQIRRGVLERESVMSTGVGKGLAIPHCKTKVVTENFAAFARLTQPIDFKSIDGVPVQIIFLLVGPDGKHSDHIKLLSRISRLMNSASFHEKLLKSDTSQRIIEAFKEEEEKYFLN
jgi:fructose-specific phosphotransferase system IIA component